jgi:hypothetical protein
MPRIDPKPFQTAALMRLQASVNAKLPDSRMVNLFGLEWPDGRIQTGITFSSGTNRSTRFIDEPLSDDDRDKIVDQVERWIGGIRPMSNWTEDPSEAAPGSW